MYRDSLVTKLAERKGESRDLGGQRDKISEKKKGVSHYISTGSAIGS